MTPKIDPKAELGERITTAYFNYEIPDFSEGYTAGLQDVLVQDLVSAVKAMLVSHANLYEIAFAGSVPDDDIIRRDLVAALSAYQAAIGGEK